MRTKQAAIGTILTAAGVHIGQNMLASRDVKSPGFKNEAAKHFISGVSGRQGDSGSKLKAAIKGVYSPESVMIHNHIYEEGSKLGKELTSKGLDVNKASKRDIVKFRRGLKQSDNPVLKQVGHSLNSANIKSAVSTPAGHRVPYSKGSIALGNAIGAAAEPSLGIINAVKYGLEDKHISTTKLGKKLNDSFVYKPIKDAYKAGTTGTKLNPMKNKAYSLLINGPAGHFMMEANKAGAMKAKGSLNLTHVAKLLGKKV